MMIMRLLLRAVLSAIGLVAMLSVSHAQQAGGDGLAFRVVTFERVKGLKEIDLRQGAQIMPVKMHKNNFTGPYRANSRLLQFFRPMPDEEERPVPAGSVKVPDSLGNRILLVAIPGANNRYHFIPIADDKARFLAGSMKMLNLSSVPIFARLNGQKHVVKPLEVKDVPRVSNKKEPHSYAVEFYFRANEKWNAFSSGYWQHEPDARFLTFFYPDQKTKRIRVNSIRELPPVRNEP